MYCITCRSGRSLTWVVVYGKRYLFCRDCGAYYKSENKKIVKVNPFVEEYKDKYNVGGDTAVSLSEEHKQVEQPSHKSRGGTGKQKTNIRRQQHEKDTPAV